MLIDKRKGDDNLLTAYRLLCMLDTAGKSLEKLIRPWLLEVIPNDGDLSPRQYDFPAKESMIKFCGKKSDRRCD